MDAAQIVESLLEAKVTKREEIRLRNLAAIDPHAAAVEQAGGKLIRVPLNRAKFNATLSTYAPGCGSPVYPYGPDGGSHPCGARVDGRQEFCPHCAAQTVESLLEANWHSNARLEVVSHAPRGHGGGFSFYRNGEIIGAIQSLYQNTEDEWYLAGMSVARRFQNTGIGHAMLQFAFSKIGRGHKIMLSSATGASNQFYSRLGGQRTGHRFVFDPKRFKPSNLAFEEVNEPPGDKTASDVDHGYKRYTYPKSDEDTVWGRFRRGLSASESIANESIAVDLDGTLAVDTGWKGVKHIGEPIPAMVKLVKGLLDDGEEVVIFTARAHDGKSSTKDYIKQWLKDNDLPDLEITNEKRPDMEKFYDDKAVAVEKNKGVSESVPWQTSPEIQKVSAQHKGWVRIKGSCGHMILNVRSTDANIPVVAVSEPCQACKRANESVLLESPRMPTLSKNKKSLSAEERAQAKAAKAPIWKAVVNGENWYVSNTHRAYAADRTLKAAIKNYFKVVEPSG